MSADAHTHLNKSGPWLVEGAGEVLPVTLLDRANASPPTAVVLPLDGSFAARAEA